MRKSRQPFLRPMTRSASPTIAQNELIAVCPRWNASSTLLSSSAATH